MPVRQFGPDDERQPADDDKDGRPRADGQPVRHVLLTRPARSVPSRVVGFDLSDRGKRVIQTIERDPVEFGATEVGRGASHGSRGRAGAGPQDQQRKRPCYPQQLSES